MTEPLTQTLQQLTRARINGTYHTMERGNLPNVKRQFSTGLGRGIGFGILSGLITLVPAWVGFYLDDNPHWSEDGVTVAFIIGILITLGYYLMPLLMFPILLIRHQRWPHREWLKRFNVAQKFFTACALALGSLYLLSHRGPQWDLWLTFTDYPWRQQLDAPIFLHSLIKRVIDVLILASGLCVVIPWCFPRKRHHPSHTRPSASDTASTQTHPFGLWLGRTTGLLSKAWHVAGMRARQDVTLSLTEASQNLLVLGGIGTGKTTRVMQPLLAQLLEQDCGGLLFDVKGDVQVAAKRLAQQAHREITVIGPGHTRMNLLAGLTPETASSFIKSILLMGSARLSDAFWVDSATELCRNTLGVLQFLPEFYSLHGLYQYVFNPHFRSEVDDLLAPMLTTLSDQDRRLLQTYQQYYQEIYQPSNDKTQKDIEATLSKALSSFNHPDMMAAFCTATEDPLDMQAVIDGTLYLVDLPLSQWGLGAKVAYTLIKLRFFNVMQSRHQQKDWDQDRPVFFMCDEYQELIAANKDGLSDLNFWDKSRSSKTIGIVSAQSVSSFYAALGDRDVAHAILQNFRQKLCFRTEDQMTLEYLNRIVGMAKVLRNTTSKTKGQSMVSLFEQGSGHAHHSETQTVTETREAVLDAALVRQLGPQQMIALLSIDGQSADDILETLAVYVNE